MLLLCRHFSRSSGPGGREEGAQWFAHGLGTPAIALRQAVQRTDRNAAEESAGKPSTSPVKRELKAPRVVVEKSARVLKLYDGEKLVKTCIVSVGWSSGDKVHEGDLRTPEGEFYICIKKRKPETPFLRSMGLSYPNAEDAERGLRDGLITNQQYHAILGAIRKRLKPPWDTPLGGAIMIHGRRNGRAGTKGCIALEDGDILKLYPALPYGTAVIIRP